VLETAVPEVVPPETIVPYMSVLGMTLAPMAASTRDGPSETEERARKRADRRTTRSLAIGQSRSGKGG
jgi:hypothetical protein